jgi:hypothetical protein
MRSSTAIPIVALGLALAGCSDGDGPGGMTQNSGTVTLSTVQAAIFSPSCAVSGCHLGPGAPFGLDLSQGQTLGNVRDVPSAELPAYDRVEPGNADDSYLYMKVTADPRISGDPMPAQGSPLTAGQLDLLRQWIEQGAN